MSSGFCNCTGNKYVNFQDPDGSFSVSPTFSGPACFCHFPISGAPKLYIWQAQLSRKLSQARMTSMIQPKSSNGWNYKESVPGQAKIFDSNQVKTDSNLPAVVIIIMRTNIRCTRPCLARLYGHALHRRRHKHHQRLAGAQASNK